MHSKGSHSLTGEQNASEKGEDTVSTLPLLHVGAAPAVGMSAGRRAGTCSAV